jgi:hypothetical protein
LVAVSDSAISYYALDQKPRDFASVHPAIREVCLYLSVAVINPLWKVKDKMKLEEQARRLFEEGERFWHLKPR